MLQTFSGPTMFVQCIETLLIICLVSFEASMIKIAVRVIYYISKYLATRVFNSVYIFNAVIRIIKLRLYISTTD